MKPKVLTCKVMQEEFASLMPEGTEIDAFDISLHIHPAQLRTTLQTAIDAADGIYDPIILGYGLCSQSVVGLVARKSRLVVFRADDCIAIFLGSRQARIGYSQKAPGTYFLNRGWIGDGIGSVFDEYARMEYRYGPGKAMTVFKKMMAHYTQLAHILMPDANSVELDRAYAKGKAAQFGLNYVEIQGTDALIRQMAEGEWSGEILVVPPGQPIELSAMLELEDKHK